MNKRSNIIIEEIKELEWENKNTRALIRAKEQEIIKAKDELAALKSKENVTTNKLNELYMNFREAAIKERAND